MLIGLGLVVDARATHNLVDDDSLSAVNNKGAAIGHQRQVANEDFLLFNFPGFFVDQPGRHIHLHRVSAIPPLGLIHHVLRGF